MSNSKLSVKEGNMPNKNQVATENIDKGRRRFGKAGVATPILMTLASQPAFGWGGGMQCLSNMMSGNLSDPNRGDCDLGWSPGGWCHPVGQINGMDTISAWTSAGFDYGVYNPVGTGCSPQNSNKPDCYTGGSTISMMPAGINADGFSGDTTLREIICKTAGGGSDTRHCITAYLNASLPGINYILTQQQVIDLCNGTIPVPGGISLRSFLDTTWQ
ncbi:MAG: hypothetical protein COB26_03025 [Piscirickettsiaceae bacterium]|nr:MAG: hypothetical protein COB26_03025 [Piscirickettsiaceae bacterium]